MISMRVNIPLGAIKQFIVESYDDSGLKILEYLPKNEYSFNKEVPTQEEIKSVEEMVKGFIIR